MQTILANGSVFQLASMVGLALFFFMVGLRDIQGDRPEGYLYLSISLFFFLAHCLYLTNLPESEFTWQQIPGISLWSWLVLLVAPALIALFVLRSMFSFIILHGHIGMVKLFFGLTLFCYLYMVGADWPIDVRAVLTIIWLSFFFKMELGVVEN